MFSIDTRELKRLEERLGKLNAVGVQFAERNTINEQAFETMRTARDTIRSEFTNRNTWTVRSVRVDRARSLRDSAEVGSTEDYMAHQEFGHTKNENTNIATPAASGESPRASVRRKPVRRANRMTSINLKRSKGMAGMSRKAINIATVMDAKATGRKYVFLQHGKTRGIYKVFGTKRKPKTRKIQDLTRRVAVIPRNPWLAPSTASVVARTDELFFKHLTQQLDRHLRG